VQELQTAVPFAVRRSLLAAAAHRRRSPLPTPQPDAADPGSRPAGAPPVWGQVVVGPPGAGKSTYCAGLHQFLGLAGRRPAVINLDPANDPCGYTAAVDIRELVSLEAVQEQLGLGPNGGLVYCMDHLAANLDWLRARLEPLEKGGQRGAWVVGSLLVVVCVGTQQQRRGTGWVVCGGGRAGAVGESAARLAWAPPRLPAALAPPLSPPSFPPSAEGAYLLFDLPGQVELFTLHSSLKRILEVLTRRWGYRLAAVQLVDAHLCRCGGLGHGGGGAQRRRAAGKQGEESRGYALPSGQACPN
jgi:hypothetical protein